MRAWVGLLVICGCATGKTQMIEGTVRVEAPNRIVLENGAEKTLIDDSERSPYKALVDKTVRVQWVGKGEASRVQTVMLADPKDDAELIEIHGLEKMSGRFVERTFPEGTKNAGEKATYFVGDSSGDFALANAVENLQLDKSVHIEAHRVQLSKFSAHTGGPHLWIVRVLKD